MKYNLNPNIFIVALSVFLAASPAWTSLPPDVKENGGVVVAGRTVFDLSHSEIFSPFKDGPLNYSGFYDMLVNSGETVSSNDGPVTAAALNGVKTYILIGPTKEVSCEEVFALKGFVNNGGNLLVLLHISEPAARLTEEFGIIVSNFVVSENENRIEGAPKNFRLTAFDGHPITKDVANVAVYGTWGLLAEGSSRILARASEAAWADFNANGLKETDEPAFPFGIIAVNEYGGGKVIVMADDAPFANRFLEEADNRKLGGNIIEWLGERP